MKCCETGLDFTELPREELLRLVGTFFGYLLVHYGMWFTEVVHHHGSDTAVKLESEVLPQYFPLAAKRLAPHLGIEMEGSVPRVLASKSREELLLLLKDIAKTWVTSDGVWFQAVESSLGMAAAKMVNDTCWSHFGQVEAFKMSEQLGLSPNGGLEALERALHLELYSTISAHTAAWEKDGSLVFTINECRVQTSRRRKEMDDYPCKSAGMTQYIPLCPGRRSTHQDRMRILPSRRCSGGSILFLAIQLTSEAKENSKEKTGSSATFILSPPVPLRNFFVSLAHGLLSCLPHRPCRFPHRILRGSQGR